MYDKHYAKVGCKDPAEGVGKGVEQEGTRSTAKGEPEVEEEHVEPRKT